MPAAPYFLFGYVQSVSAIKRAGSTEASNKKRMVRLEHGEGIVCAHQLGYRSRPTGTGGAFQERVAVHYFGRKEVAEVGGLAVPARACQCILQVELVAIVHVEIIDLVRPPSRRPQ